MRLFSNKRRPVHLGPFMLERLPRLPDALSEPVNLAAYGGGPSPDRPSTGPWSVTPSVRKYADLFDQLRDGGVAETRAPIPDDPAVLADNLKAGAYFLDMDQVATARIPDAAWIGTAVPGHQFAIVLMVEWSKQAESGRPGADWVNESVREISEMRAAEVAAITAGYIRQLGWSARSHAVSATDVDLGRLALQAGLVRVNGAGELENPYLGKRFSLAAITTDLEIKPDHPLAPETTANRWRSKGPAYWLGRDGVRPGIRRLDGRHRPLHMGRFPSERLKRVDQPTTHLSDNIPRVPKRASFFTRARLGDLGKKVQVERERFAMKSPSAMSYGPLISNLIPMQEGDVAAEYAPGTEDAGRNAEAVRALAHALGGDLVGICAMPDFAWYSHHDDGSEITPYHRNAIVILLDQGFETMEGASGDDWISGAQSMRAYMRGAEIAGVIADHLRRLGHSARSHTNMDSDMPHLPLILLSGLGELSRIGELVLNPFLGPRTKSVVVTTDMPLTPDRPIDFRLQEFCETCNKCARECPCGAIPFGDKSMFNGYEMWKPDTEKCTRYRTTNQKGSACGRCMKTCPYNAEGLMSERFFLWLATHFPASHKHIARLDDKLRRGAINPVKKWWFDLEVVAGNVVEPKAGTNRRELDVGRKIDASSQKIAHYPFESLPPALSDVPHPPNRKEGVKTAENAERPPGRR